MKICVVCGYGGPDTIRECPNCGSYEFKKRELEQSDPRLKRWN